MRVWQVSVGTLKIKIFLLNKPSATYKKTTYFYEFMLCEICGKDVPKLVRAEIEGAELMVCPECSSLGKVLREPQDYVVRPSVQKISIVPKIHEPPQVIENFGAEVKKAREKLGLTREELAKKIFEKESLLVRIENTNFEPEEKVIRKLEKALGIKLIE